MVAAAVCFVGIAARVDNKVLDGIILRLLHMFHRESAMQG